jgi:nucleoside-diphosphate kinase
MRNADIVSPPPNSTLALIKPHILRTGRLGNVLEAILADGNFEISSLFCFHFTLVQAEELFDAYRGIFDDYSKFIENLCSGPVVAVGISGREGYDTVSDFRDFAGPVNPQIAKVLRPDSLRAQFGDSYLDNALHCTDLPEDGDMECRYIFNVLARLK